MQEPTRRPKVLLVNSTLHIGGAEQVSSLLAQRIDRQKFDVSACYLKEPGHVADQMLRAGVDLFPLPGIESGRRNYLSGLALRKVILARGIQIIHTHDIHGLIVGAMCRMVTPGFRHVHTFHYGNYPHRRTKYKILEGALWRIPDALIAVGHEQAATLRSCYGIPEGRLRVLWNGVDDSVSKDDRVDLDAPAGVPIVASISTLIPQKGLEVLLDAASLLRQSGQRFLLVVAGDGVLRDSLVQRCKDLALTDHVRMLGWVPRAAPRVLPDCDVFVQSSLWEAMSVVVLEAMAAGKPIVLTRVGENAHVIVDSVTGIVVPPANPAALAQGLLKVLRDPSLAARMGDAARRRYLENFTVEHMISRHEALYRELNESLVRARAA